MYLEVMLFVSFVFFAILDVRHRSIKAYWFVGLAIFVITYKISFEFDTIQSDTMVFGVSAIFVGIAYVSRMFGIADLFGILVLSFAVPEIGPIPTGIPLLLLTLIFSNWAIILSNIIYNISDVTHNRTLFSNITNNKKYKFKTIYWFFLCRRKRPHDRFILSAEKVSTHDIITLSVKRNNKLLPTTKYVFSAHPQFVYSTIAYSILWFVGLSF